MALKSRNIQAIFCLLTTCFILIAASNYTSKLLQNSSSSESHATDKPVLSFKSLTKSSSGNQLEGLRVDVLLGKQEVDTSEIEKGWNNQTEHNHPRAFTTPQNVSLNVEPLLEEFEDADNPDMSEVTDFAIDNETGTENLHSIVPVLFSFFHILNTSLSEYGNSSTSISFKEIINHHEANEWQGASETDQSVEQQTNSFTNLSTMSSTLSENHEVTADSNGELTTNQPSTVPSTSENILLGNLKREFQKENPHVELKSMKPKSAFLYSYTTRSRGEITDFPVFSSTHHGARQMKDDMWRQPSASQMVMKADWHSYDQWDSVESLTSEDVQGLCKDPTKSAIPHPDSCARYINCSVTPDAVMTTYFQGYVMECPYPQLFSDVTLQCEDFTRVSCGARFEPKSPCEYRAHQCHESSHCVPCWVRFASCRGLSEGLNAWQGLEWEPFFVECHKERTVFQGLCDSSAVFSPITRACETPMSIPSKHGGWKPGCLGRRDGSYPDEFGRCDLYFLCQGQLFRGFHKCRHGHKFNPFTSRCQPSELVPLPCGDRDEDGDVCRDKDDGNYADIFGRCTHYFTCKKQKMAGLRVCPKGVFNVFTRKCDTSKRARAHLPRPCGELKNVCLHRADGRYGDIVSTFKSRPSPTTHSHCVKHVVCQRGLTIAQPCSGLSGIGLDKLYLTE